MDGLALNIKKKNFERNRFKKIIFEPIILLDVERSTPGEEIPSSIPAVAARSLLVGSVSV